MVYVLLSFKPSKKKKDDVFMLVEDKVRWFRLQKQIGGRGAGGRDNRIR